MNQLSRSLGKWLFNPYKCSVCKQKMNIHDGIVLDPKDSSKVIHKECKNATIHNYKNTI